MTLSARGIALQGFAFTPIAIAVQGLIALLIEEEIKREQGPGGKRRKSYSPTHTPQPEELTREAVERQWDLLETRLRNQAEDAARKTADAKAATGAPAASAAIDPVAVDPLHDGLPPPLDLSATEKAAELLAATRKADAIAATRKRQSDEDEAMLLLLLMA